MQAKITAAVALSAVAMCVAAVAQEAMTKQVQEPETLNVVFGIDSSGTLTSLERATAAVKASAKLTGGVKQVARIAGATSATWVRAGKYLVSL